MIPDTAFTAAAASLSSKYSPQQARLRNSRYSWCATMLSSARLNVDLGQLVSISGLATQGDERRGKTTEYVIRYGYDGRLWYDYPSQANQQVRFFKCSNTNKYITNLQPSPLRLPKLYTIKIML